MHQWRRGPSLQAGRLTDARMTFAGLNQSLVARLLTRPSLVYERYDEHQMEMIALLTARKQEQQHR